MRVPDWVYADDLARHTTGKEALLNNADLKPVEPARRQWKSWNYVAFWLSDSININTWMIVSSSIQAGLSWWEAWLTVWIGYTLAAFFVAISGRIGSTYHISFPPTARASFGIFGSLWPVFNRGVMACIWYGTQAWLGGQCFVLMFRAIGPSYDNITNDNLDGTGTRDFVGFFLFWFVSLAFIYPPVHKIRHLFTVKAAVVPLAGVLYFVWAVVKADGLGPIVHQGGSLHGSARSWAWISGIMSCLSNFATLIVNNPDFTRFAKTPKAPFWPQLITIPAGFAVTCFIGVIVGSASKVIYGTEIWSPLDLLGAFLKNPNTGEEANSATRAGVFFIALAFALAQLGVNIAANSVSAGSDLTSLLPRYLNIRRSGYICAAVGILIQPWKLLSSSSTFTTYLSAYAVFLSSIAGVMFSDYYLVRKGYLDTRALYSSSEKDPYWFSKGFNWRAYVAYVAGIMINIVGFVGQCGVKVSDTAQKMYQLNFFLGLFVAGGTYYALCKISPIPACGEAWCSEVDNDVMLGTMFNNEDSCEAAGYDKEAYESSTKKGDVQLATLDL